MARTLKDSGIDWIGQIPEEWTLSKIGQIYSERNEKVSDLEYEPLSVTMQGIVPQLSTAAKSDAHDDRRLVKKGDFAINSRSDRRGSCGISPCDGSVSLINTILKPRKNMNAKYYNWVFHSSMFSDEFYKWGHGIVNDLWTTRWQDMKKISIPFPKYEEQEKIAEFLDLKCSAIDSVIEKTKASIEEYKRLKQTIITQAVTKGINSKRLMKDSGIEWIGEIPEGWNTNTIGRFCFVTKLAGFEYTKEMDGNILEEGDVPIVRAQNVKMGKYIPNTCEYISFELSEKLKRCALERKCVLITFIGAGIGETTVFPGEERSHLAPNVAKIEIHNKMREIITEEYLAYYLMSFPGQEEVNKIKKATAQPSLSMQTIRSIKLTVPNSVEEQKQIVKYIDEETKKIDILLENKEKIILKTEELKKSLIYEYVTGKKEV